MSKNKKEEDGWLCVELAKMTYGKDSELNFGQRCLMTGVIAGIAIIEPFVKAAQALGIPAGDEDHDDTPMFMR